MEEQIRKMQRVLWQKLRKYIVIGIITFLICLLDWNGEIIFPFTMAEKPRVALTFDDGPCDKCTQKLLQGLRERGVKASFFLIGKNIEGKEALVQEMLQDGHLIGNHTYNHVQLDKINTAEAKEEINQTNNAVYEATGYYPEFIRPPYGAWPKNLDLTVEMIPVLWNMDTLDWKSKNEEQIFQIVRSQARDGSIILMHDLYHTSVESAFRIVDELKKEGFDFVTVDRFLLP